jgi:hypothetical protein
METTKEQNPLRQFESFAEILGTLDEEDLKHNAMQQLHLCVQQSVALVLSIEELQTRGYELSPGLKALKDLLKQLSASNGRLAIALPAEALDLHRHFATIAGAEKKAQSAIKPQTPPDIPEEGATNVVSLFAPKNRTLH